jgi:glycosyltransferase involved in cell wall biosynthesis
LIKRKLKNGIKSALRKVRAFLPTETGAFDQAVALAQICDCTLEDLKVPQQNFDRVNPDADARVCNWYLPYFDNAFYGGIMTILRFANYLSSEENVKQRFLICSDGDREFIAKQIAKAFPGLADSEVIMLDSLEALNNIPPSDYSIATLWTTAYILLKVNNTGLKFYFIQDYEPLFYAAGSTYAQAELPYWFGFYGIANTVSLKNIYEQKYGGKAQYLTPCVDRAVFHPGSVPRDQKKKKIFLYARPNAPRNGFEITMTTVKLLKNMYQDKIEIVCAGGKWNPSDYGLGGVVENLGLLSYQETGDLYRSCHIGFVMMMTRHPSYLPFEFMASGTLVVTNYNPANLWFLKDGENCLLSPASASSLCETLSFAIDNYDDLQGIRDHALRSIDENHSSWDTELKKIAEFLKAPGEPNENLNFYSMKHSA